MTMLPPARMLLAFGITMIGFGGILQDVLLIVIGMLAYFASFVLIYKHNGGDSGDEA